MTNSNNFELIKSIDKQVRKELSEYSKDLLKKNEIIVLNKIDLVDQKELEEKRYKFTKKIKKNVTTISILDKKSVNKIKSKLIKHVS